MLAGMLKKLLLAVTAVLLFLLYSPTLLDFRPVSYSIPFKRLEGPLKVNSKLSSAKHLFQNALVGPESIVFYKGDMYTGTESGQILRIRRNKIEVVARTGQDCKIPYEEKLCGRPLGLRVGKDEMLYVLDSFYGLFRMNFSTGLLTRLLSSNVLVDGEKITFPDDFDMDDDGNVYMSDASTKWDVSYMVYLTAEFEGSGRIIRFNVHTREIEVILKNLYFPNGVQISHDGNSLLVAEILKRQITRYFLKGPKKGQTAVFIEHLPGEPDNIRLSSRGGYWVALVTAWDATHPQLFQRLTTMPVIRKLLARAHHALGTLFMTAGDILSSHLVKEFGYKIRRMDAVFSLLPQHGIILELDDTGNIIQSYQSPDGNMTKISQVTEHEGHLYLGSYVNKFVGKLKI